ALGYRDLLLQGLDVAELYLNVVERRDNRTAVAGEGILEVEALLLEVAVTLAVVEQGLHEAGAEIEYGVRRSNQLGQRRARGIHRAGEGNLRKQVDIGDVHRCRRAAQVGFGLHEVRPPAQQL